MQTTGLATLRAGLWLCLLMLLARGPASAIQAPSPDNQAAQHNLRGLEYFKTAFYQLTPKDRHEEAAQYYAKAEQEFGLALGANPNLAEAHRNLGRLSFVRGKFAAAAESYHKVTQLQPKDLDAYVLAALAHSELHQFEKGIAELERAKRQTSDPEVTAKLEGYIEKLRNAK